MLCHAGTGQKYHAASNPVSQWSSEAQVDDMEDLAVQAQTTIAEHIKRKKAMQ